MLESFTDRLPAVAAGVRAWLPAFVRRLAGSPKAAHLAATLLGIAALAAGELAPDAHGPGVSAGSALLVLPWLRSGLVALAAAALFLAAGLSLTRPRPAPRRPAASPRPSERERQLQASVDELLQWRIRLERQAQRLAEIADASLREKGNFELEVRRRDELLTQTGHDLRTALNAVIGFSDLMVREVYGPLGHAKYGDYARHVHDSGMALLQVADQVLVLSARSSEPARAGRSELNLDAAITQTLLGLRIRGRLGADGQAGARLAAA